VIQTASRYGTPDIVKLRRRFISVKQGQASATDMQKKQRYEIRFSFPEIYGTHQK
jgi:hypothetical protein